MGAGLGNKTRQWLRDSVRTPKCHSWATACDGGVRGQARAGATWGGAGGGCDGAGGGGGANATPFRRSGSG